MDLIFFEKPQLLLYIAGVVLLHIISFALRGKKICLVCDTANIALHSAAITAFFMNGGNLYDALALVLFSALVALFRCEKPERGDKNT